MAEMRSGNDMTREEYDEVRKHQSLLRVSLWNMRMASHFWVNGADGLHKIIFQNLFPRVYGCFHGCCWQWCLQFGVVHEDGEDTMSDSTNEEDE